MKNQRAAENLPPAQLSFSKMKLCFIFEEDVLPESSSIAARGPHSAGEGPTLGRLRYPSQGCVRYPHAGTRLLLLARNEERFDAEIRSIPLVMAKI